MKTPLKYNNETVGNLKEYELDEQGNVEMLKFLIYDKSWYDRIFYEGLMDQIKRSATLTLDKNPDLDKLENNTLYQFDLLEGEQKYLLIRKM